MRPVALLIILVLSFFFSSTLFAFVSKKCPNKFVGKVIEVSDMEKTENSLNKVEVTFETIEVMLGEVEENPKIIAPKFNQIQFNLGEKYLLETNNNKICTVQKI